jgi:hypothetical protein
MNLFCDGSGHGGGQSQTYSLRDDALEMAGGVDGGSRWEEGWSEHGSEAPSEHGVGVPLQIGPCPEDLGSIVSDSVDLVSDEGTGKVCIKVGLEETNQHLQEEDA